jgi:hypothetical protein
MSNKGNPSQHRAAAHSMWAGVPTAERTERTQAGRDGHFQKFLDRYHGDEKQARNAWKAHFSNMALKSAKSRKAKAPGK